MTDDVLYRQARREDLPGIARVFLAAFPESVQHYVGREISPRVTIDAFAICLAAEPKSFFVAELDGRIVGYIFAPSRLSRLFAVAVWHGHLLRMFYHWVTGQYGFGMQPVWVAVRNWLSLWQETRVAHLGSEARIFSIAVDPAAQGHGIGAGLLRTGLHYLESLGSRRVRLEVRPENEAAVHLYEKFGFRTEGKTRDSQGDWLIMLKDYAADKPS